MVMQCCGGIPLCTGLKGFGGVTGGVSGNSLYPRLIDVLRSKDPQAQKTSTVGLGVYEGRTGSLDYSDPSGLMTLFSGLACAIDSHGIGRSTGAMLLPGDVVKHPQWKISIPGLALHSIRDRDILIDDEKYRYEVAMNGWTIVGYVLNCIRLET
jgi:hypothetical protein